MRIAGATGLASVPLLTLLTIMTGCGSPSMHLGEQRVLRQQASAADTGQTTGATRDYEPKPDTDGTIAASQGRQSRSGRLSAARSQEPADLITRERWLSHVVLLAHDELEGRDTGTPGIDVAAGYIAGQFAAAGIQPGGPNGTYFQNFIVKDRPEVSPDTTLTISGADVTATVRDDFTPFGFSKQGSFEGELMFAGYGITSTEKDWDDYANLDVKGRVVLILRREPPWLSESGSSPHATFESKVKLAAANSAAAVLIVNPRPDEGAEDNLMPLRSADADYGVPALHVKRAFADKLLAAAGAKSLDQFQDEIDQNKTRASTALAGLRAAGNVALSIQELKARNVIGMIPGNGPKADEYVVIGGHYDHLGVRRGQIHNGADDNASGTAGVIEACRALAQTPNRNRSVVCMAFSGEERGLHGSEHYCAHPTVPIESIKAMMNMDMIGRLDHDSQENMLAIQGLGTGSSLTQIIDRHTNAAGIKYIPDPSARGPSDHAPFYEAGVPAIFFFTGVHDDYHQPGDDVEKVNVAGGVQVTRLVYAIARDLVNAETPPVYAQVDQPARIMRGAAASGVVLGIMPDMEDASGDKGWKIAQVFPGGGAASAGMKAGDRILLLDGREINSMGDYREATKDKKPGDKVAITVQRGAEQLVLDVELQSRESAGRPRGGDRNR